VGQVSSIALHGECDFMSSMMNGWLVLVDSFLGIFDERSL
jgi:hypothetical protein